MSAFIEHFASGRLRVGLPKSLKHSGNFSRIREWWAQWWALCTTRRDGAGRSRRLASRRTGSTFKGRRLRAGVGSVSRISDTRHTQRHPGVAFFGRRRSEASPRVGAELGRQEEIETMTTRPMTKYRRRSVIATPRYRLHARAAQASPRICCTTSVLIGEFPKLSASHDLGWAPALSRHCLQHRRQLHLIAAT
jgi:hypothetical protein